MIFFWKKVKSISELNPPKGKAVFLKKGFFLSQSENTTVKNKEFKIKIQETNVILSAKLLFLQYFIYISNYLSLLWKIYKL